MRRRKLRRRIRHRIRGMAKMMVALGCTAVPSKRNVLQILKRRPQQQRARHRARVEPNPSHKHNPATMQYMCWICLL